MIFTLKIWPSSQDWPELRHGYTPPTEDEMACLRLGPLVIGWGLWRDEQG